MVEEKKYTRIKAVFQIVGKPKEYIEGKMKEYIQKIQEDDNLMLMNQQVAPVVEKEKLWSSVGEIELVIKGSTSIVGFCIDYMPASIEIIKPEAFHLNAREYTGFLNDLIGKLHTVDTIAKQAGMENRLLKQNMNILVENILLILMKFEINSLEKMSRATRIAGEELTVILEKLITEGKVEKREGLYYLKNG